MVQIILSKLVSDDLIPSIDVNEQIETYTDEYIKSLIISESYDISGTQDFFNKLPEILGLTHEDKLIVVNIWYNSEYIIQVFNKTNVLLNGGVLIKRKIMPNDNYTFSKFNSESDPYDFLDMTQDDLVMIVKSQFINKGVLVSPLGNKSQFEYINLLTEEDECIFKTKLNHSINTIKYINLPNFVANKKTDQIKSFIETNITSTHVYSQHHIGIGILFYLIEKSSHIKNEIVSKLLSTDIYGEVYVGLYENNQGEPKILDLTIELFDKIINSPIYLAQDTEPKNKNFCNIYLEC